MKYRAILLFGAPGVGKGTQGKVLGSILGFLHVACGEIIRSLDPATPTGQFFRDYANRGLLVPDERIIELWQEFLEINIRSGRFNPSQDTLVLDGIPRTLRQAELLQESLDIKAVFYLRCSRVDELIQRLHRRALKENRADDASIEVIRTRLEAYETSSKPLVDFYGPDLVREIDASQLPARIVYEILGHLLRPEEPVAGGGNARTLSSQGAQLTTTGKPT